MSSNAHDLLVVVGDCCYSEAVVCVSVFKFHLVTDVCNKGIQLVPCFHSKAKHSDHLESHKILGIWVKGHTY